MCQSKRMACCRAVNLFGKAHRVERPNASTLLFSASSCSAPGDAHFHRVIVDSNEAAGRRLPRVVCWSQAVSFAPGVWNRHQFGGERRQFFRANGIWLMCGKEDRIERRTLAALARCSARGSRSSLRWKWRARSADGLTCRGGRLVQIRSQRSDRAVLVAVLHGPHPL